MQKKSKLSINLKHYKLNTKQKQSKRPSKMRMIGGIIVLVSGFLSPLLIPLVLASQLSPTLKSVLSGMLAFGIPELFMLVAIGIFGKAGYNYFKRYISLVIKIYGPPDEVSLIRYRIGLVFFCLPLIAGLILPYVLFEFEFLTQIMFPLIISLDVLLLLSVFVLGGNFWDKLRGLFLKNAKIQLPK